MLPRLLVVGAGNSGDPGPARLSIRPSGERSGGGDCLIGEEIGPPPPSPLSFDTILSNGQRIQKGGMLKKVPDELHETRQFVSGKLSYKRRRPTTDMTGYGSCATSVPSTVPVRSGCIEEKSV